MYFVVFLSRLSHFDSPMHFASKSTLYWFLQTPERMEFVHLISNSTVVTVFH